jgi:hypothetical protein
VGTLSRRASEGLSVLRRRLATGGVRLGAVAFLGLLTTEACAQAPQTLPADILGAVGGTRLRANVLALAKGGTRQMFLNKVKLAAAALAAVVFMGTSTAIVLRSANAGESRKPPRVSIDAEKRIRIGGKPFFPIGIYSVPPGKLAHARELGFNTVHTYLGEGSKSRTWDRRDARAYLDEADGLGLKVFMGLPRYQVRNGMSEPLQKRIDFLKTSPALLVLCLVAKRRRYHEAHPGYLRVRGHPPPK